MCALLPMASVTPLSITSDVPLADTVTFLCQIVAEAPESSNVPAEMVVPPA